MTGPLWPKQTADIQKSAAVGLHYFFASRMDSYSLDELKSRLKMSQQIEVKITTSSTTANGGSNSAQLQKKSRKSKTPVFRQRRPSSEENGIKPERAHSLSPESPVSSDLEKRPIAAGLLNVNEPPLPPPPGGIKSYSDFMRSLAAKYNNNE